MHFGRAELTRAVIGIPLMLHSAHGDEEKHHISEDKSDAKERTLVADIHHARKKGHQYTRNEESVRQDLDIYRRSVREKALGPNHEESDQQLNANANPIIS